MSLTPPYRAHPGISHMSARVLAGEHVPQAPQSRRLTHVQDATACADVSRTMEKGETDVLGRPLVRAAGPGRKDLLCHPGCHRSQWPVSAAGCSTT